MILNKSQTDDTIESAWGFQAGNLALDFANTVDWHASDQPKELLNTYVDLVKWAYDFSILTPDEAQLLIAKAKPQPESATNTLEKAIDLRESIYSIFTAIAHDNQPRNEDLERLKMMWGKAVAAADIASQGEGFAWTWERKPPDLEKILWPISLAAVNLLLGRNLSYIRQCADDRGCGLLFIDTSRNHSRQWCNMASCGNRAKAQRHYHRSKRND